jgi:hypothetical protein
MRASIFSILAILFTAYLPMPAHAAMQEDVDQAVTTLNGSRRFPRLQFRRPLCGMQRA